MDKNTKIMSNFKVNSYNVFSTPAYVKVIHPFEMIIGCKTHLIRVEVCENSFIKKTLKLFLLLMYITNLSNLEMEISLEF